MVANSFNPLDQSSEVMTLAEMLEREVVCSSSVSGKSCIQSLNVYHPEEKNHQASTSRPGAETFLPIPGFSGLTSPFPSYVVDWGCEDQERIYS